MRDVGGTGGVCRAFPCDILRDKVCEIYCHGTWYIDDAHYRRQHALKWSKWTAVVNNVGDFRSNLLVASVAGWFCCSGIRLLSENI